MSSVMYSSTSSRVVVEERRRSPLGRFAAWLTARVADTALQAPVASLVDGSVVTRLAVSVCTGLAVGFALDFAVRVIPQAPILNSYGIASIAVGAAGGFAAGGGSGALLGSLWAWLIGSVVDTVAADQLTDPTTALIDRFSLAGVPLVLRQATVWTITMVGGWAVGSAAAKIVDRRVERFGVIRRATITLSVTVVAGSLLVAVGVVVRWLRLTGGAPVEAAVMSGVSAIEAQVHWIALTLVWLVTIGCGTWIGRYRVVPQTRPLEVDFSQFEEMRERDSELYRMIEQFKAQHPTVTTTWRDHVPLLLAFTGWVNGAAVWTISSVNASIDPRVLIVLSGALWTLALCLTLLVRAIPPATYMLIRHWCQASSTWHVLASLTFLAGLVAAAKCR